MKHEEKMSFCVVRKNHRRKISWFLGREMQLRMSKTSHTWSLEDNVNSRKDVEGR